MALQYKKYEGALTNLGTVAELSADYGFTSDKNLNSTKRVTLVLLDDDKNSVVVTCSEEVSSHIRGALKAGKTEPWVLSSLRNLSLLEDKDGRVWVSPTGDPNMKKKKSYTVAELALINADFDQLMAAYERIAV